MVHINSNWTYQGESPITPSPSSNSGTLRHEPPSSGHIDDKRVMDILNDAFSNSSLNYTVSVELMHMKVERKMTNRNYDMMIMIINVCFQNLMHYL